MCLLGMAALVPLIETVDSLITFSQKRDVFICDFIGAVKVCEGQLYSLYNCHSRAFTTDEFFVFKSIIEGTHNHIHTHWVLNEPENPTMFDLNYDVEPLAFVVNGNNMYVKRRNEELGRMEPITREAFVAIVEDVKTQCSSILALPRLILLVVCMYMFFPCLILIWLLCRCGRGCRLAHTRAPTLFSWACSFGCIWHHLPIVLVATRCKNHLFKAPRHSEKLVLQCQSDWDWDW